MRQNIFTLCLLSALIGTAEAQVRFFPEGSFSSDAQEHLSREQSFAAELRAMDEGPLIDVQASESYRFTWLRSFHKPMTFRLDLLPDGSAELTAKVGSGRDKNNHFGPLEQVKHIRLNVAETTLLKEGLARMNFWTKQSRLDPTILDGADWLLEGKRNASTHAVLQNSPGVGRLRDWALDIMRISGFDLEPIY